MSEPKSRNLWAACLAHALHDGYTDALYAFLPVWQTQFRLSYAGVATLRALYYGTMGGLQIPVDEILKIRSSRWVLVVSTLIAAGGYLLLSLPSGFVGLCSGLVVAGVGSSMQHPRGSLLVSQTYGAEARGPLGIYNFSGDLGKAILPALAALLLPVLVWRRVVGLLAGLGLGITLALLWLIPKTAGRPSQIAPETAEGGAGSGFYLLALIGAMDTATRMGYLLFLPFLVQARGGTSATVGLALALLFVGGALGKATCSWLAGKLGVVGSVLATEAATALLIAASLFTPLVGTLWLLPLLGVVLNGTSSVLYGTVPDMAPSGDTGRAFAIFYTCVIGSGGLSPIVYGAVADHTSQTAGILMAAVTAAAITPLLLFIRPHLKEI